MDSINAHTALRIRLPVVTYTDTRGRIRHTFYPDKGIIAKAGDQVQSGLPSRHPGKAIKLLRRLELQQDPFRDFCLQSLTCHLCRQRTDRRHRLWFDRLQ